MHIFNVWTINMQSLNIKEQKLLELQITQTRHPLNSLDGKNVYAQHPSKMRKYSWNVHKIGGAYLQCVNNHYAKFGYKEIKTDDLQITQTRYPKSVAKMDGLTDWTHY